MQRVHCQFDRIQAFAFLFNRLNQQTNRERRTSSSALTNGGFHSVCRVGFERHCVSYWVCSWCHSQFPPNTYPTLQMPRPHLRFEEVTVESHWHRGCQLMKL